MAKANRREVEARHSKIASEVLQEWRALGGSRRQPSGQKVAHDMIHRLFEDVPPGAFRADSKIENA